MDDKTQAFDPNRTQMSPGPSVDPNRTQMGAPPVAGMAADPHATTAFTPPSDELTFELIPGRAATMANGPAREQFLLEIAAPGGAHLPGVGMSDGTRTPLNLCLVLDKSGSMEGPPLEYAKQACSQLVDVLSPNDVLSIILFDEIVETLMEPQRVTDPSAVKAGIAQIGPGYTTNLYDGMSLGAQKLGMVNEPGRATRMIVLTDGEPTAGIKEFQPLVEHAAGIKQQGITCTFLGFGPEYNEELLASMAKRAGGNYYYIPEPQLIPEIFRTELNKLMSVQATSSKLWLKTARWVELRGVTGHEVTPGQQEVEIDLADLEKSATMQVVVDLDFPNHPLGHYRVAEGKLTYTDAKTGQPKTVPLDFVMEFTADANRYSAPVDPRVGQASEISAASRAVERTIMGMKTQALSPGEAMQELQKTQAMLAQQGRHGEAQEVTMAMQAIQSGDVGGAEKTLMGTMVNLDSGKKQG